MKSKNYLISNIKTRKSPVNFFGSLLINSINKKVDDFKKRHPNNWEAELGKYIEANKSDYISLLNGYKQSLESIMGDIKRGKVLSLVYKRYAAKSLSFYDLFLRMPSSESDIFEFKTIRVSINNNKKIFDFIIKDEKLAKERIEDIIKIIDSEILLDHKNRTLNLSIYENLNLTTIKREDKEIIYGATNIEEIEEVKIIDDYEDFYYEILDFESLKLTRKNKTDEAIQFNPSAASEYTVGVLDEKIHDDFLSVFDGIVEYENLINDEDDFLDFTDDSHAEAVSSIVMMGDKLNGVFDGNGIIKTKIFSVLSKDTNKNDYKSVIERIQRAVTSSPNIKVFVLSMGLKNIEQLPRQITPFGIILDQIAIKYNVRFITTGGNDEYRTTSLIITPPGDSELAITVNSLDAIDGNPSSYSRMGYYGIFGNKPTLSFFGGDKSNSNPIKVYDSGMICGVEGTSLAAPWVARYYSRIYHSDLNDNVPDKDFLTKHKHEYAEAILINDAIINTDISYFNDMLDVNSKNLLGAGKLPLNKFECDSIRYLAIFQPSILESGKYGRYNYLEKIIPLPKINGEYDYSVAITVIDIPTINHDFGADYILTTSSPKIKIKDSKGVELNRTQSKTLLHSGYSSPYTSLDDTEYLEESDLAKKGKWKRLFTEKFYINKYHSDMKGKDELYIELNLEKTYRYDSHKEEEKYSSIGADIKSIIVYEYELGESIEFDEFNEKIREMHKESGNYLNEIEVGDIEVGDIEVPNDDEF